MSHTPSTETLNDPNDWRIRIILAYLLGSSIYSTQIPPSEILKLVDLIKILSPASKSKLTEDSFYLKPSSLVGGQVTFDCGLETPIPWFLNSILLLSVFSQKPCSFELSGITNAPNHVTIDTFRTVTLPNLVKFHPLLADTERLSVKVKKRGAPPLGGGLVYFNCPNVPHLNPITWTKVGPFVKIRGISYETKISGNAARLISSARKIIDEPFSSISLPTGVSPPDIRIYRDSYGGINGGKSPGFGVSLVAVTDEATRISSSVIGNSEMTPEDAGALAAKRLLAQIPQGGVVDTTHQSLLLLFMSRTTNASASCIRLGPLSNTTISTLRAIYKYSGLRFLIKAESDSATTICSCIGKGVVNISRRTN